MDVWTTYSKCSYNESFRSDWWYLLRYYFQPPAQSLQSGRAAVLSFVFPAFVAELPQPVPNSENKPSCSIPLPEPQGFQNKIMCQNNTRGPCAFELFHVSRQKLTSETQSSEWWSRGCFTKHVMDMKIWQQSQNSSMFSLTTSSCSLEACSLISQRAYVISIDEELRKLLWVIRGATVVSESNGNLSLKVIFSVSVWHEFQTRDVISNLSPENGDRGGKGQRCWRLELSQVFNLQWLVTIFNTNVRAKEKRSLETEQRKYMDGDSGHGW